MAKWFTVVGTFEYPILAENAAVAIEQAEEDFAQMGLGIMDIDSAEEM